ncbi:MAG: autotransporter domain-containing protein, partial [Planctomycetes bacterium]|nr:autotransporter domain-containing protein [Planctomycetota bacterium]
GIGYIGASTGATGTATVSGSGSSWTNSGSLQVGTTGTGTLTIAADGAVTVGGGTGTLTIATNTGSVGTLNIGADALAVAAAPGTLSASSVAFGAGTGTLVFNHTDTNYTFDPTITGNGTIEAVAGTTILSGDLSGFTGTTNLSGGILEYTYGGSSTITAAMTGAGALDLSSGGTTTITSNSAAFTGTTTVNNGSTLSLGGTLGGTLNVNTGGTLKGTGTAEDVTANAGSVIAPGNSIGTLTMVNLIANPGSTYEVEIETDGTSDLIHATGTATLNGGAVELIPYSGRYHPDIVYTIVTADGGVAGTYDDVTLSQPSLFITPTLSYDATNVYATTTRNGTSFASVADTANQKATAAALDPLGVSNLAYEAVVNIGDAASAQAAFDQLSGEIYAGLQNALIGEQHSIGTMLFDRLDRLGERTASIEPFKVAYAGDDLRGMFPKGRRMSVWAQGFGSWGNVDGNGNSASVDSNSGGVMLGAEGDLNDAWQGGGAIGYGVTTANSSARASKASSKNYHAALYAGTYPEEDEPVLRLGANATWHALQSARDIEVNGFSDRTTGDYNAYTAQAFVDVSQPVSMDSNSTLAPFGSLSYIHQSTKGFTEHGGDASLNVDGTDSDFVSSTFGLRGSRRFEFDKGDTKHATLNASLGWKHTLGDVTPESSARFASGSDSFTVEGAALANDAIVYDTSFTVEASHSLSFGVTYSGQLAADAISQSLRGQIKYSF